MTYSTIRRPGRRLIVAAVTSGAVAVGSLALAGSIALGGWTGDLSGSLPSAPSPASEEGLAIDADGFGTADGLIPETESVGIESDLPAVTRLDEQLRDALREASASASAEEIVLDITSGWRSEQYQAQLFDDAVREYGSEEAAREFVAPPTGSKHVTGDAVDIGGLEAQLWLGQNGFAFGLCQTYSNERWHFELATMPGGACPEMRLDARDDWS
jgi:hypothetical protein